MNENELNRLLLKYYKGECTEKEEQELSFFFNSGNVPEGYEAEKAIFSYFMNSAPAAEPSTNFEKNIFEALELTEKNNSSAGKRRYLFQILSAAAGILILFGSWFFFSHRNNIKDTYTDPKIAYAETMKILYDISAQLNDAEQTLEPVSQMTALPSKSLQPLSRSGKIVEETIEDLGSIHKVIENTHNPDEQKSKKK